MRTERSARFVAVFVTLLLLVACSTGPPAGTGAVWDGATWDSSNWQ
jgi:hypothetical protein